MLINLPKSSILTGIVAASLFSILAFASSFTAPTATLAQGAAPAQPTGLEVTSEDFCSISISWDDPQDDSITGYQVLRRSRDGDSYGDGQGSSEFVPVVDDTGEADTEYTDDSVTPETRYVYWVKARNPAGLIERSSFANAETTAVPESTSVPTQTPASTPEAKQVILQPQGSTTTKDSQEEPR